MKETQRPLSPFMIGPYYRPQMTSVLSIAHRATGVFLSVIGAPLLLWWIIATSQGPAAYAVLQSFFASWPGVLLLAACLFCLGFHTLNGIRHLIWDTGRMLEIRSAYTAGVVVLVGTVLFTVILLGVLL